MALKFLNKNGWHAGSLRNIENVWKAEQKHEAEQRKLEELRKQIQDERENSEFLLLQGQAGLVPYAPVPHLWFLGATETEKVGFPLGVRVDGGEGELRWFQGASRTTSGGFQYLSIRG
ncbi:unnamed protein product [Musa banksii]